MDHKSPGPKLGRRTLNIFKVHICDPDIETCAPTCNARKRRSAADGDANIFSQSIGPIKIVSNEFKAERINSHLNELNELF